LSVPRTFSTVPTVPNTRTRTRTQVGDLDWGQVGGWMRRSELCVRETSLSFIKITISHLLRLFARYAWIWVYKSGPHKFLGILSMLRVSEVWKNKLYSSFTQVSWVLCPRSWVEFEYHQSLYSNSTHHKKFLYSTQVLKYSL
jgi:hypothetical protein